MPEPVLDRLTTALAGRYELLRELGRGGMATVYLARDSRHSRQVAIKVLHPELAAVLGAERFLAEIRTTANLQHPHILPLFDSGSADGQLFYVMPFVEGETLRGRLDRETQLPIADAVQLAREVADALQHAHERGVIHRDIKPENILLQGGHALVADFGIALAVQQAGGQRMTQTGLSLGTPQYMAPEQAMGEKAVDARADIYALGAVTYEMLAGEPPFTGPTAQAIIARALTSDAPPLESVRKAIPSSVADAVHRALEKLPADRFNDARSFVVALTSNDSGRRTTSGRMTGPAREAPKRRTLIAWFAATLLVGLLGGWAATRVSGNASATAGSPLTVSAFEAPTAGILAQKRSIALTPDGTRLAFLVVTPDGGRQLLVRRLDDPVATPLADIHSADVPFWSPDSRTLGFFNEGFLTVRDANGTVRRLCPAVEPSSADWGSKNIIIFTHRLGISTVSGAGGACRLVVPRGADRMLKAAMLPDGERFVYAPNETTELRVARLDGTTIATLPLRARDLLVVPPRWLALMNEQDGLTLDIQEMDWTSLTPRGPRTQVINDLRAAGGEFTLAFGGDALVYLPGSLDLPYLEFDARGVLRDSVRITGTWTLDVHRFSPGVVKVAVGGNVGGLWLYDVESDRGTRLMVQDSGGPASRMLGATYPLFNRDGSRLVYIVRRGTYCDIVVRDLATDVERSTVRMPRAHLCPRLMDWSDDEREVLAEGDSVLRMIPLDGSPSRVAVTRPGRLLDARISPDRRTIAYSSDETERAEVYVRAIDRGSPILISQSGGRWPNWGATNGMLYFMAPDGRVMVVAPSISTMARASEPRALFSLGGERLGFFEDRGIGLAVLGNGERFFVRQSPAAPALRLVRPWTELLTRPAHE
ncbi:MAG: protein kinase [Gemmatimonas sp.]